MNDQMVNDVNAYVITNNYRSTRALIQETIKDKIKSGFVDLTMSPFQEEMSLKLLEAFSEVNERLTRMLTQMDTDYLIVREDENIYE